MTFLKLKIIFGSYEYKDRSSFGVWILFEVRLALWRSDLGPQLYLPSSANVCLLQLNLDQWSELLPGKCQT